jgi:hypothetical protein
MRGAGVATGAGFGEEIGVGHAESISRHPRRIAQADEACDKIGSPLGDIGGPSGRHRLGDRRRPIGRRLGLEAPPICLKPACSRTMTLPPMAGVN